MTTLQLFGRTAVRSDDGSMLLAERDFGGAKPRQILEVLGTSKGEACSKDLLTDLLWGETPPAGASANLESYVSLLRRRLGEHRAALVTTSGGYALERSTLSVDLDTFDCMVAARGTPDDDDRLAAAVRMADRPVLESEPYADWAIEVRREYTGRLVDALVRGARSALERLDHGRAVDLGRQALGHDELREDAWVIVIAGLQSQGLCMQALRTYDRCRQVFRQELGVEPSSVLRHLQESLLARTGAESADVIILVRSLVEAVRRASASRPEITRVVLGTLTSELSETRVVATP